MIRRRWRLGEVGSTSGSFSAVLRNRRFTTVAGGEGLSMVGDAAFTIALAWIVLDLTGSITALAGVLLVQAIPRSMLLLLGGAVVDALSPRQVMLVCHLARAGVMAAAAVLAFLDRVNLGHLYGLAFVMGVAAAFSTPAGDALLPALLPSEQLDRGNAIQGSLEQGSLIVGPMLGALLTSTGAHGEHVFAFNAVTFGIAAMTVRCAPGGRRGRFLPQARTVLHDISKGLSHAKRTREVRLVLLVVSAAALSYSGLFAVGLPVLARSLSENPAALAVMVSAWGTGQLIGALCAAVTGLPHRWGLLIIAMTLAEGIAFASLGVVATTTGAAVILCLLGVGVSYSTDVALPTFIQTTTPQQLLGRTSALLQLPRVVLEPLSIALLALALQQSLRWGFALTAVPVLTAGIVLALNPFARELSATTPRAGDPGQP